MESNMLPPRIRSAIKSRAIQAHTVSMEQGAANIRSANNIVRHSAAKFLDEPTPAAARAIDKILRAPRLQPRPAFSVGGQGSGASADSTTTTS